MNASFNKAPRSLEVEFFVWNTYDVPHMAPIIKELQSRGIRTTCFVKKPFVLFKEAALKRDLLAYYNKVVEVLESYGLKAEKKRNYNADVVLISQMSHKVRNYKHMKVKIGYGASPQIKDCHHRSDNIEGFDAFLVHGKFEIDNFSQKFPADRLKVMGAPKFDAFFQTPPDREALKRKWNLITDKKIIVYLPTWDQDRSIGVFEEAICSLKDDYMIVCKPHNNTFRYDWNKPDREKLARMSTRLINAELSLGELALVADLLLTDIKSGASTESIYLTQGKTPWIGLTSLDLSEYYPAVLAAGPVLNDPTQLKATVEQMFRDNRYESARRSLNTYCYGNPSGSSMAAKDAADAIIELAQMEPHSQKYPYFLKKLGISLEKRKHAIKSFFNRLLA